MKTLLIYDSDILPIKGLDNFDDILVWQYLSVSSRYKYLEILNYLEDNKLLIREKYLEFTERVSSQKINGIDLREVFFINKKFPLWEMSLINEKSSLKSPFISHILRFIAFELWIEDKSFDEIHLFTNCTQLNKNIESFCRFKGIVFNSIKIEKRIIKQVLSYLNLSYLKIKKDPILWLIYFSFSRIPLLFKKEKSIIDFDNQLLFITYLFNINKNDINKPYGIDTFWKPLCKKIFESGKKLNYLSIFAKSKYPKNIFEAINIVKLFQNINSSKSQVVLLDSFLSFKVLINAVKLYIKVKKIAININPDDIFKLSSGVDISHLFLSDWIDSFQGKVLMQNALYCCLFDDICKRIINPYKVVYLYENQNWEFAFIAAFKSFYPKVPIYAYCHSSLRFWDLRYFSRNSMREKGINLEPNFYITNGPQATSLLVESGLNKYKIKELEAIRYLYLNSKSKDQKLTEFSSMPSKK